jgi:hypothetical protein
MRTTTLFLVAVLTLAASNAQAALKDRNVQYRQAIMQDGQVIHETHHRSYGFLVEIVNDSEGVKPETFKNGRPFVAASKGERYSVRLYNPLPVRVAVNLTVDGLNSITGKPSGIADGEKWMIEPFSSITIPGWQVNNGEARRFFFTEKPKSYAKWRGDETGKDLAANCGVIGAAYFWNQQELDQYYNDHPIYRYSQQPVPYTGTYLGHDAKIRPVPGGNVQGAMASNDLSASSPSAPQAMDDIEMKKSEPKEQAGTGMGERQSNPTYQVEFNYNTGMYSLSQAVVIYYDFVKVSTPNPFPGDGFAPEM